MYQIKIILFSLFFLSTITVIGQQLPYGYPETERTKEILNQGWKFLLDNPNGEYYKRNFDDSSWKDVNVPHTFELASLTLDGLRDEKTQLVFHRKVGWYRKNIRVSNAQKKIYLEFEGAHQVTDLWVNGQHVGQYGVGGYTPFHFDITEFVERGKENQVTLLLDNRRSEVVPPDPGPMDYVNFSGLYRDLYLVETDPVHVTFNWETMHSGVNITTPTIDVVNKNATINIKTAVKNEKNQAVNCSLITRIIDKEGVVVLKLNKDAIINSGVEHQFNQIGSLEDNVQFWSIDNPYLYRVNSVVVVDGKTVDFVENKIGLRKFEQDPIRGFVLNGKPIELLGYNRHQQYPYVGDAVPNRLHYKDMLQFKEFGFNVVRAAHYPQDDALLEACDELGILVYEEAPTWIAMSKNEKWWDNLEQAARTMIRNHRNHPSVVIWGAGVNHRGYVPRMHNAVKQEDPTRLTASQGATWTGWQASGLTDINANMLYGDYLWDRSEPLLAMEGRRGPRAVAKFKQDPLLTGLISWTAHAYYTFHPRHDKANSDFDRTRSGQMTIFRYPRPMLNWYKSEELEEPVVFIKEEWKPGIDEVTVYSNAASVELFLNGQLIATERPSKDTIYNGLAHPPFHFRNMEYVDGILKAKAIFKDGTSKEAVKRTPEKEHAISLEVDKSGKPFLADGSDIIMAYATIIDKNGTTVSDTKKKVTFTVQGDAAIVGEGANINANPMFTEYGVAPVLIRAGKTPGKITLTATSKGLESARATIDIGTYTKNYIAAKAEPIYDFKKERVDIGAEDQLVQFGWNAWHGKDGQQNHYHFKSFKDASAKITTGSQDGLLRWLGEMNVIGKYGYIYGEGVLAIDAKGMNLTFENLPKGTYNLTTWHHAPKSNTNSMDPNKERLMQETVHKLPYERTIIVSSDAMNESSSIEVKVTEGEQMQWEKPGTSIITFSSDGIHPVTINFNGVGDNGIWLNAFELSEWKK